MAYTFMNSTYWKTSLKGRLTDSKTGSLLSGFIVQLLAAIDAVSLNVLSGLSAPEEIIAAVTLFPEVRDLMALGFSTEEICDAFEECLKSIR